MKQKKYILGLFLGAVTLLSSCSVDNMDAPDCHVYGKMCYQGKAIGVCGSGKGDVTNATVQIELWQAGFGKETALNVNVAQDGTFSTYIYSGDIRLITKKGVGPWENADTIKATVRGDKEIDYEVKPYFTISDDKYTYNATDSTLTATFHVTQVVDDANVKSLGLIVNNTQFVDLSYVKKTVAGSDQIGDVSFTMDCKSLKDCKCLYARVYVKSDRADQAAYSTIPYKVW